MEALLPEPEPEPCDDHQELLPQVFVSSPQTWLTVAPDDDAPTRFHGSDQLLWSS